MYRIVLVILLGLIAGTAAGQTVKRPPGYDAAVDFPEEVRVWFRNPDGSCVQCSIGMVGVWQNCPQATTLLWNTDYGSAVRGGSGPSRVEAYADKRKIPIYNVTGESTWEWMKWAARNGRMVAIGCFSSHFQTLCWHNPETNTWFVCNNNSPKKIDEYTWAEFKSHHLRSGQWVVLLKTPPPPPLPQYVKWW